MNMYYAVSSNIKTRMPEGFAGFLLSGVVSANIIPSHSYTVRMTMALTDTFVKQVKPVKPSGDKYTDGEGMYLLVLPSGKYRRVDYRFLGKRKTMAWGGYPATSLAKARIKRTDVRENFG